MNICRYNPENSAQWNQFNDLAKNGLFMFNRSFMDYHADRFQDHSLMVYSDDGKLIALLPANERDKTLYSHQGLTFGGFVTDTKMRAETMLLLTYNLGDYLKQNDFKRLIYKPSPYTYHRYPSEEDLYGLFRVGAHPYRIDISSTIQSSNRLSFAELRKRGVKKATKAGVTVRKSEDYAQFMKILSDVLEARHGVKPVHSVDEIVLLTERFPSNIQLYIAEANNEMLAGVLVFVYDNLAHAQYIAASPAGREVGALDKLFDNLINDLFADKNFFDFGVSTEHDGTFLNEGLINQKEGFGGRGVIHQFFEWDLQNWKRPEAL